MAIELSVGMAFMSPIRKIGMTSPYSCNTVDNVDWGGVSATETCRKSTKSEDERKNNDGNE